MTMSRDQVRFFLPSKYYQETSTTQNSMSRNVCANILQHTFCMTQSEIRKMMDKNPEGFWIRCRPSQFGRFIVRRHHSGECINGIRELCPELVDEEMVVSEICVAGRVCS